MADKKGTMHKFSMSLNHWIFGKVKTFADENDMTVRGAIRHIIHQFFKINR
jgi:hypothetical protein